MRRARHRRSSFRRRPVLAPPKGTRPCCPSMQGDALLGFVYLNSDFTGAVGYSGKPVRILVGIDTQGTLIRFKLVDHKEPIVLVGVPERRVVEALNTLIGTRMGLVASGTERAPQPDIVSGATVTVLVMADSVVRSAVRLMKSGRISPGGTAAASGAPEAETKSLDMAQAEKRDWQSLLGDGSVRRLKLTVADVNQAFEKSHNKEAAAHPELGNPDDTFIDLYVALASAPVIGRSLLGDSGYEQLRTRLKPGQQALVIAGDGRLLLQGIRIRSRRHFRSHRTRTGRVGHALPRPQSRAARCPRGRGRANLARHRSFHRS